MLNVVKDRKGDVLLVRLSGSIEESVNFEQIVGTPPPELHLNCKEVVRINSEGVKSWIRYFNVIKNQGVKTKFIECSTAIVEQINLISSFSIGAEIESIYVPFSCKKCHSEFVCLFKTEELKKLKLNLPHMKCAKCSSELIFDDIPTEYFAFLSVKRQQAQ